MKQSLSATMKRIKVINVNVLDSVENICPRFRNSRTNLGLLIWSTAHERGFSQKSFNDGFEVTGDVHKVIYRGGPEKNRDLSLVNVMEYVGEFKFVCPLSRF